MIVRQRRTQIVAASPDQQALVRARLANERPHQIAASALTERQDESDMEEVVTKLFRGGFSRREVARLTGACLLEVARILARR